MRISSKNAICLSVVGFLTVLTAICGTGEVAQASTFYVDSTDDTIDATPGDGVCDDGAGSCSLRAAIMEANALVGADIIDAPAGTYTLTIPGERENAASTGDLDITDELTITGAGESSTIIDGGGIDRVFEVIAAGNITDVTIQNGAGSFEEAAGAGIYNTSQQLTLNNVTIIGNQTGIYNDSAASTILADSFVIGNSPGSGIVNYGTVEIRNAAIQGNTSADWGGGINNLGTMTIDKSLISGNSALGDHANGDIGGFGGGIYVFGKLTISNTTISGNSAEDNDRGGAGEGGGIYAGSNRLILDHVTIADNQASSYSDLFLGGVASMQQKSTIIANNLGGDNCGIFGAFTNLGHNLDSGNSCGFMEPSDLVNTDPLLGPLQDNGGPTFTHALLPGSPAIDHILPVNCIVTTDQRGISRPQGDACDIGAYELDNIFSDGFERPPALASCPCPQFDLELLQTAQWGAPGTADCRIGPGGTGLDLELLGGQLIGPGVSCASHIRATQDLGEGAHCGIDVYFEDDCTDFSDGGVDLISPDEVIACQAIIRQMADILEVDCPF